MPDKIKQPQNVKLTAEQKAVKQAVVKSVNNCMFGGLPPIEITAR